MTNFYAHPATDDLELYCLNRLPASAGEVVEEHLLLCSRCNLRLEVLAQDIVDLRSGLALIA